jgi:ADP-L-glycero-D-manno-heptose 6-epimerase
MRIIVTGACGFIGSNLVKFLNDKGYEDLILVDNEVRYLKELKWSKIIGISELNSCRAPIFFEQADFVIHLGALTDTFEQNYLPFDFYNEKYSKVIWEYCTKYQVPLIYASSAGTYGNGANSFSDNISPNTLLPLNPYAKSKNEFDKFAFKQSKIIDPYCQVHTPPFWAGLKFFNVYGINEFHKNKMASVVYHAFNQIKETGEITLFKYGHQKRDFVYIDDVCEVIYWLLQNKPKSDIYNVGTGKARTFLDLGLSVFNALWLEKKFKYIDIPQEIQASYQSYTQADMSKLIGVGYNNMFTELENGVAKYVKLLKDGEKEKGRGINRAVHTPRGRI